MLWKRPVWYDRRMKLSQVRTSRKRVAAAYSEFRPEDLIIRDLLALDRTTLANEQTFLSYIRTALSLGAAGAVVIKLSPENPAMIVFGCLLLVLGIITILYGGKRFLRTRNALLSLNEPPLKSA